MTKTAPVFRHTNPDGETVERISVFIPLELKDQVRRLAKSRGHSLTYTVAAALRAAVDSAGAGGVQ